MKTKELNVIQIHVTKIVACPHCLGTGCINIDQCCNECGGEKVVSKEDKITIKEFVEEVNKYLGLPK